MNHLSLYDYLGKAAGSQLGQEVAQAAMRKNIRIDRKNISNPSYTGEVLLYPKNFLDEYFKNKPSCQ